MRVLRWVLPLVGLLAACSLPGIGPGVTVTREPGEPPGAATPTPSGRPSPTAVVVPGRELPPVPPGFRLLEDQELILPGGGDDPPTLDPALANDSAGTFILRQVMAGLVRLDENLQVVPDLAERWEVSEDGRTYTFYLRPGLTFHSGRPLTAEDVRYSLERATDPSLGPAYALPAGTYLGDIVGVPEKLAGKADSIAGIRVLDERTIQITIDAPKSYFLAKLTYNTGYVVNREVVEKYGDRWTEHLDGAGPFRLVRWDHRKEIVLEPFEGYYAGPSRLQRIRILLGARAANALVQYEEGRIHWTDVPFSALPRIEDPSDPIHGDLRIVPELSLSYVGFNVAEPPFDDPQVRKALVLAVDRYKLAHVMMEDRVSAARGVLPPGMPGYNPNLKGLPYDPEAAREALARSRYAGKVPRIRLYSSGGAVAPALKEIWEETLGVEVELRRQDWPEFLQGLDERRYPAFVLSWIADYPHPQNFLEVLFGGGSPNNYTRFQDDRYDALLRQAALTTDPEEAYALYQKAEAYLVEEAVPVLPLFHGVRYIVVRPEVRGLTVTPMGILDLWPVFLAEEAP